MEWHSDQHKATVFADVNEILWEHHRLMMEAIGDRPCHKYTIPMTVELYGEKPDLKQFREWLETGTFESWSTRRTTVTGLKDRSVWSCAL